MWVAIGFWWIGFMCGVFFLNQIRILANRDMLRSAERNDNPIGDAVAKELGVNLNGKN